MDPDRVLEEYRAILEARPDPSLNYGPAQEAVSRWLANIFSASRSEEADHLEDCLARVLVHLTTEEDQCRPVD